MDLMYVDESGDTGLIPPAGQSPTRYFCLTGLVVHELRWAETHAALLDFRRRIKRKYKVYLDDEIHAGDMLNKPSRIPKKLQQLRKYQRLAIIRHQADAIARLPAIRLVNVVFDKEAAKDTDPESVFQRTWYALFQRFENTILHQNFPGPPNDQERGIIFPDQTDGPRLRKFLNAMRIQNHLFIKRNDGQHSIIDEPIRLLIEDPVCRDSRHSYFIQAVDGAVFLLKQHIQPSGFCKKHGANAYFSKRLKPVLCLPASHKDPFGVVHL